MAPSPDFFFDLSLLLPDDSKSNHIAAAAVARALDLGYSAVALDRSHRGILAHHSSLPHPQQRHYTRLTLSLDSAAACASALAPSAARLLRTYDIVAARPLTQAAFDHLCQSAFDHLDLISIDFSHKLPFRLKLPMIKLALHRGLHFEIAYSPLIADAASVRQAMPEAKLLVEWTKGKNLIISSAAHTASQIRGPYDAINLCAYLLRLSTQRAKAAISLNCRSLISKALRKKHFYKETIRIDRLLPNEQFNSANFKLAHWIGSDLMPHKVDPISLDKDELPAYKGDLQSLHINPKPSSNKDDLPHLPINGLTKVSCNVPDDSDQPLFVEQQEQSSHDMEILYPLETQEGHVQVDRDETLKTCGFSNLPASFETDLGSPVNDAHHVQTDTFPSVDPEGIEKHVEFLHDSLELDGTESCKMSLIVESSDPISSYDKLACSAIPCSMELSGTPIVTVDQATQDRDILSGSSVCPENKGLYPYSDISVFSETPKDHAEPLELPPCGVDDEAPSDLAVHLHSDLCRDVMMPQRVIRDEVEPVDRRTATVMEEHTPYGPEMASTASLYDKGSSDTTCKTHELAKQNSNSLEGDVAKTNDELLQYSYASSNLEVSLTRAGKRTKKLRLQCPGYLPFLGFLKSVSFKKKASKYACRKTLASSRARVKGRFARNSHNGPAAEATSAPADESLEVSPHAHAQLATSAMLCCRSGGRQCRRRWPRKSWTLPPQTSCSRWL